MNRRLVWCAVGGALSTLLFWAVAHASEPPFQDFGAILWVDGGDPLFWPNAGGKPKPSMTLVGDSLKDIVHDSEGGQMPSREEFEKRVPTKEGESDPGDDSVHPTPPRAPDAGGPGRVLAPPTAWLFGIFNGGAQ